MKKKEKLIKPAQFAENEIIKAIINNEWPAGHKLPPERELADLIGITRPTLREVLQRLSRDGWLTIIHGKSTTVNDYKTNGGLGVLKTFVNYKELSSTGLIEDWLQFRIFILPGLAEIAIRNNSKALISLLERAPNTQSTSMDFAIFDWDVQMLIIKNSHNSIALMLYNDLTNIYHKESSSYFKDPHTKKKTLQYYNSLKNSILSNSDSSKIIKTSMEDSYGIWKRTNQK